MPLVGAYGGVAPNMLFFGVKIIILSALTAVVLTTVVPDPPALIITDPQNAAPPVFGSLIPFVTYKLPVIVNRPVLGVSLSVV